MESRHKAISILAGWISEAHASEIVLGHERDSIVQGIELSGPLDPMWEWMHGRLAYVERELARARDERRHWQDKLFDVIHGAALTGDSSLLPYWREFVARPMI